MTQKSLSLPLWKRRDGVAAVEFAIVAPLLLILVIGVVELGFAVRDSLRAQQAAAAGAAYASSHSYDAVAIHNAAMNSVTAAGLSVTVGAPYCGCPDATGVTAWTCGTNCPDAIAARQYVDITTTLPRTSIFASTLPLPTTITRHATARMQ